jgi:hypothetical protein
MAFNTDPRGWTYAHMCRDEHVQIGHNDSEHEMCPVCRAKAEADHLRAGIQAFLDGDYEPKVKKIDKCPHGVYGYDACEACIEQHFYRLLNPDPA